MPQEDMQWDVFVSLANNLPSGSRVILHGEGEPTLHPRFWDMAEYLTIAGHNITTTLNGTQLDIVRIPRYFRRISISIDSLDEEFCNRVGRTNVPKVLRNIVKLLETYPAENITIRAVDMGQSFLSLAEWAATNRLRLVTQPLQTKPDYANNYPTKIQFIPKNRTTLCSYLTRDILRYYTVRGLELPCCFIKNTTGITTIENMKHSMPLACLGCDK